MMGGVCVCLYVCDPVSVCVRVGLCVFVEQLHPAVKSDFSVWAPARVHPFVACEQREAFPPSLLPTVLYKGLPQKC